MNQLERDELVAEVLRDLPVPDHRPHFWADLERAIGSEQPSGGLATTVDRRPDTGELPAVRPLSHARARRRNRGPWLAVAAAVVVLAGAVGLVALAGDGDEEGAELAATSTAPREEPASSTAPPTSVASTTASAPPTPVETVRRWLDALGAGDSETAAALLGPRSLAYLASVGGDATGLMDEYQEGYGAWSASPDAEITATEAVPIDLLGPSAQLIIVTVTGTHPGEGDPASRTDVIPVVVEGDQLRVETAAFADGRLNQLVFTVPRGDDTGRLGAMGPGDDINVFVPAEGTVLFQIDGGGLVRDDTSLVGRNQEPFALCNPTDDLALGPHRLVVVAVGADGTITTFAGTFEVTA